MNFYKTAILSLFLFLMIGVAYAQKVEPPHWWIGFKNNKLQLLFHHQNINKYKASIDYPGVNLVKQYKAESKNYLFLDLVISETTKPGRFEILFKSKNEKLTYQYQLKERTKKPEDYKGFNSSDVVYLITPDRFTNGDPSNDSVKEMKELEVDRSHGYKRHGGDIKGIINHLDYLDEMGFTTVWPTPLLTNDMYQGSYHGYAITDYYKVDPRFGDMDDYKKLSSELKKRNMKLVMDMVANHCGLEHWWMKDLPFKDWVNYQEHYEKNRRNWNSEVVKHSNHKRTVNQDLYASKIDKEGMVDGWFVDTMPDLNQRNPFMATYIIQNSIWWIETLDLGGIRQDTYPYPDKNFMANWAGAIMTEYPNFSIVGEEWSYNPLLISYWQQGMKNKDGYISNLKSTMDFALTKGIVDGLNEKESWDKGLVKIYEGLANDFIYPSPKDLMIFPDNHDKSRIFTELKGDVAKTKMAMALILSLPRIPQVYYGTEILLDDFDKPGDHGLIRTDFPGGWSGDKVNAFTGKNLTKDQKEMQQFLKTVVNFRKNSKAIHQGKTIHFAPKEGVYVLTRWFQKEGVIVMINKSDKTSIDTDRFDELGLKGKSLKNLLTGKLIKWGKDISIASKDVTILTIN